MDFKQDDPRNQTWKKEDAKRDGRFDFAPFLGPDNLNDRVTHAADGKDVLDEEAFGDFSSVIQKIPFDGRHGRHLSAEDREALDKEEEQKTAAQTSHEELEDQDWTDEGKDDLPPPADYRDNVPPRPKIIVAEPTPKVYVDPRDQGYDQLDEPPKGSSGGQKGLAAVIIAVALTAAALAAVFFFKGRGTGDQAETTPTPSPANPLSGIFDNSDRPTQPPAPTPTPTTAPAPETVNYTVIVTAGTGGSVSPSGAVLVQQGSDVSFVIQPDQNYEIAQVLVDGADIGAVSSYMFTGIQGDHTLYAVFRTLPDSPPPASTPEPTEEPAPEPTEEPPPILPEVPTDAPEAPPEPGVESDPDPGNQPGIGDVPPAGDLSGISAPDETS